MTTQEKIQAIQARTAQILADSRARQEQVRQETARAIAITDRIKAEKARRREAALNRPEARV